MRQNQPDLSAREGRIKKLDDWLERFRAQQVVRNFERLVRNSVSQGQGGINDPDKPEEICTGCGRGLGFPQSLRIDDQKRWENGALYVEGGGQLCGNCAKIYSSKVRFDMRSE